MTPIEMVGAFARLFRSEGISRADLDQALTRLVALRNRWIEVLPGEQVRELAQLLIQRHPLRAADAAQLAAAVVWSRGRPRNRLFISLDGRLAEAASIEGFEVEAL
jgi:predicted nucleic acid-binding protein